MKLIRTLVEMNDLARAWRNETVVLVPTMGALHAGHLSLIDLARDHAGPGGKVVVSIFVNPLQFGPREDLSRYPRPLEQDLELCKTGSVDAVFHPEAPEMYPNGNTVTVEESTLAARLCGQSRPGHFRGVCTVVAKLFNLVRPDKAVFGMKDYQQLVIIRRMVHDLNFPIEILAGETVREPAGLALSSRNAYLSSEERAEAAALRRALLSAQRAVQSGEADGVALRRSISEQITREAPLGNIDYVEIADAQTLETWYEIVPTRTVAALAVFFGRTRLIDNILL